MNAAGHIIIMLRRRHLFSAPPPPPATMMSLFTKHQLLPSATANCCCCSSRRRRTTTAVVAAAMPMAMRQQQQPKQLSAAVHHYYWRIVSSFSSSASYEGASISDDWREWFRSSDYDDPWSPYYPFPKHDESATATTIANHREKYEQKIVPSILGRTKEGETIAPPSWQRRRHGMNLEPLTLLVRGETTVTGETIQHDTTAPSTKKDHGPDNTSKEEDTTVSSHGMNEATRAENVEAVLLEKAQARMRRMDTQTRFLCRMLDDLYRTGIWRESDRPTVERCHRAIGRLLTMTPEDPTLQENGNDSAQQPHISFTGLAQRAGAILQRMEACTPPPTHAIPSDPAVSSQQFMTPSSYQDVYPDFSPHLLHTKFVLPSPTREIYNMVLLSYSKEVGPLHVAQQAEDVVWSMIVRARRQQIAQQPTNNELHGKNEGVPPTTPIAVKKNTTILLPSTENWNCVLKCWSKSTDPHRSFYAYSFLLSWIEWNKQYLSLLDEEGITNMEDTVYESKPNLESFRIVLRSCLVDKSSQGLEKQRAKQQIGSGVAIRLWKEMQTLEIDSTTYLMLVRAICQTSELPTTVSTSKALTALARVYTSCCKDGMLTDEISNLVEAATTKPQFTQLQAMAT